MNVSFLFLFGDMNYPSFIGVIIYTVWCLYATNLLLRRGFNTLASFHELTSCEKSLFCGLELVSDRDTHAPADEKMVQAVVGNCMAQGIIIGATNRSVPGYNNTLCLSPALISTKDDLDQITASMDTAITEVFG